MKNYTRTCMECGELFSTPSARRKICSQDCVVARSRRTSAAKYAVLRLDPEFRAKSRLMGKRRYTTRSAEATTRAYERTARWHEQNPEKALARGQRYRQEHADQIGEKNRRRYALLQAVRVEPVDIEVLWVRDRGICGICRRPIDRGVKFPAREALTIDHVIPLIQGGLDEYANTQIAHHACNSRKDHRSRKDGVLNP